MLIQALAFFFWLVVAGPRASASDMAEEDNDQCCGKLNWYVGRSNDCMVNLTYCQGALFNLSLQVFLPSFNDEPGQTDVEDDASQEFPHLTVDESFAPIPNSTYVPTSDQLLGLDFTHDTIFILLLVPPVLILATTGAIIVALLIIIRLKDKKIAHLELSSHLGEIRARQELCTCGPNVSSPCKPICNYYRGVLRSFGVEVSAYELTLIGSARCSLSQTNAIRPNCGCPVMEPPVVDPTLEPLQPRPSRQSSFVSYLTRTPPGAIFEMSMATPEEATPEEDFQDANQ